MKTSDLLNKRISINGMETTDPGLTTEKFNNYLLQEVCRTWLIKNTDLYLHDKGLKCVTPHMIPIFSRSISISLASSLNTFSSFTQPYPNTDCHSLLEPLTSQGA